MITIMDVAAEVTTSAVFASLKFVYP
jgi:hypothetical protein